VGFFTDEECATNSDGLVVHDGTWTYKIPTVDTIPKQFNVELVNSAREQRRVLSSKGEVFLEQASVQVGVINNSCLQR
jgi:xanthine dehydrogenase molybdopterin-binding subunit B